MALVFSIEMKFWSSFVPVVIDYPADPVHFTKKLRIVDATKKLQQIRNCAIRALWYELITFPKPGLVSLVDSGSHKDMDAKTFYKSIFALRHYFYQIANLGNNKSNFQSLRLAGIDAEKRMMLSTKGVNTHRGAIFILGILAAAAAFPELDQDKKITLGAKVKMLWGNELVEHICNPSSHGSKVREVFKVSGALGEVCSGFPSIYSFGLPVYQSVLKETSNFHLARIQTFFSLLANVEDTNLLHRGGFNGLRKAQSLAKEFLSQGGIYCNSWETRAKLLHQDFIKMHLSPGGSADLLGACIFVHEIESA